MTRSAWLTVGVGLALVNSAWAGVFFTDTFESGPGLWTTLPLEFWGPLHLETWPKDINHTPDCVNPDPCDPRGETAEQCYCTAARQYEHSQAWNEWQRVESPGANRHQRLSVWMLDQYYRTDRNQVEFVHFQVQAWIMLLDPTETEHFLLGFHAHWTNPEANWLNYSFKTVMDGWNVTTFARSYGWHHLEIVLHPYTGAVGDVEFFVDGQLVGQGRRQAGSGQGVHVPAIRIGANPAFMTEDNVANTYQNIYYDDVEWSQSENGDYDFDGDSDVSDFLHFQACFNGPDNPPSQLGCSDADADGDGDVDVGDFLVFQACFNGPDQPVSANCPA